MLNGLEVQMAENLIGRGLDWVREKEGRDLRLPLE